MDSHRIKNSLEPINSRDLTTKNYVDNELNTKSDLSKTTTQTFQGRIQVPNFNTGSHSGSDIVNLKYLNETYLNKKSGRTMFNPITFSSSLPNNKKQIFNLALPQYNSSATNKDYVDGEVSKMQFINTVQFLKIDGTRSMTSNLNLGGNKITNLRLPTNNEDAVSKIYMDGEIAKLSNIDTASFLKIGGSRAMTGDLDLGSNKITNLKTPTADTDAANKSYIDETLSESHLVSSSKTNTFVYIDIDDTSSEYNIMVNSFTNNFHESPHKNKKAFEITLTKDVGTNNYRSRMGFNLYPFPLGTYTMIFEFFPPEITNIQLSCQATSAYIHKQVQRDFSNYSKMLVQINNNSKITPDFIYLTIRGTAVATPVKAYLIVYANKDWCDNGNPEIYDHDINKEMFEYYNGDMKMNTDLYMDNHMINNLKDGVNETGAVNKGQLDAMRNSLDENVYKTIFGDDFYDLIETIKLRLKPNSLGVVIQSVEPNLYFGVNKFINNYDHIKGIEIDYAYLNLKNNVNENTSYTIFISLHLESNFKLHFSSSKDSSGIGYYPIYNIEMSSNRIIIEGSSESYNDVSFTSDYTNRQQMIWICHDGPDNLYKLRMSNSEGYVRMIYPQSPSIFNTKIIKIIYDGYIKKIAFVDRFIDVNSLENPKIILEEGRNGSYFT